MFEVVLHQPEIAPNTGNIIRLCANAGARLHVIEPLGFSLAERAVRRAGMDYRELADLQRHASWEACATALAGRRFFAVTTRGETRFDAPRFEAGDVLVFGSETRGLPQAVMDSFPAAHRLRIPMRPDNRSMNLSNAVAVVVFEAWRQRGFSGAA